MIPGNDPIAASLDALARSTLAAPPPRAPLAVLRILADRRRAEIASRRLRLLVAIATVILPSVLLGALVFRPPEVAGSAIFFALLLLVSAPTLGTLSAERNVGLRSFRPPRERTPDV